MTFKSMDEEIMEIAKMDIIKKINIATEVLLVTKFVKLYYNELMQDRDGMVTSRSLISWLDDYKREGTKNKKSSFRAGVLSTYQREFPSHFEGEVWTPSYLPDLMWFTYDLTSSKEYTGKKSQEFVRSFQNEDWIMEATAITGLKILENRYKQGELITGFAANVIGQNIRLRNLVDGQAKLNARQMKNHNYYIEDMRKNIEDIFKHQHKEFMNSIESLETNEYKIYREYKDKIEGKIRSIPGHVHNPALTGQQSLIEGLRE